MKLSPNVTSIAQMARVCEGEGADALSLVNAVQGMLVDVQRRRTVLRNGLGGLSGPAIFPIALRMVYQASAPSGSRSAGSAGSRAARTPSPSCSAAPARSRWARSATPNPRASIEIRDQIAAYCRAQGVAKVRELIGGLRPWEASRRLIPFRESSFYVARYGPF